MCSLLHYSVNKSLFSVKSHCYRLSCVLGRLFATVSHFIKLLFLATEPLSCTGIHVSLFHWSNVKVAHPFDLWNWRVRFKNHFFACAFVFECEEKHTRVFPVQHFEALVSKEKAFSFVPQRTCSSFHAANKIVVCFCVYVHKTHTNNFYIFAIDNKKSCSFFFLYKYEAALCQWHQSQSFGTTQRPPCLGFFSKQGVRNEAWCAVFPPDSSTQWMLCAPTRTETQNETFFLLVFPCELFAFKVRNVRHLGFELHIHWRLSNEGHQRKRFMTLGTSVRPEFLNTWNWCQRHRGN